VVPAVEQRRSLSGAVIGDRQRQFPLGCHVCDEIPQPAEEGVAGRILGQQGLAPGAEFGNFVGVDGDDQFATRREVPIHRGVADAGPAGDVVERGIGTLVAEDVPGRGHEQVVVALGVRAPTTLGWHDPPC
jgi:hypothetical protein